MFPTSGIGVRAAPRGTAQATADEVGRFFCHQAKRGEFSTRNRDKILDTAIRVIDQGISAADTAISIRRL